MIESYALTDIGCTRKENQDRVLADHALGLFAVADGMGGHRHGEIAAELAISSLRYFVEYSLDRFDATWPFGYDFELSVDANRLSTAVQLANQQVWQHSRQSADCDGMGTTVAAILLGDDECAVIANVGDSRIYQFRYDELKQLSYDDTLVNSMSQQGADPADLANHPMRNVLTQAAGSKDALNVHVVEQRLASGDLYLICSDGLHGVIGNAAIRSILASSDNLEEIAQRLNQAARGSGGPDNISVVLLSYSC